MDEFKIFILCMFFFFMGWITGSNTGNSKSKEKDKNKDNKTKNKHHK
jgi:hypothetical protein